MTASAILARWRELFLAPGCARAVPVTAPDAPLSLAVVCAPAAAAVAGAAVGLAAAARAGSPCAVVCRWTGDQLEDAARTRGGAASWPARRLAGRLAARGLAARAHGRLVTVTLPAGAGAARAEVARVAAASGAVPVVLVVAGPRSAALDAVLVGQDVVIVVPPPGSAAALEALAVADAARLGRAAGVLRLPESVLSRISAGIGIVLPPRLRRAATAALSGSVGDGRRPADERGQALLGLLGVLCAILLGAAALGAIARGLSRHQQQRSAADLAALAGAEALRVAQPRLFVAALVDGLPNPRHLERESYLSLGRRAATETALRNGARRVEVAFPDADALVPVRVAVTLPGGIMVGDRRVPDVVRAVAEVTPVPRPSAGADLAGAYRGPLARRQGKQMRPDVALAFDRLAAAARRDGVTLIVVSGFRSDAEQARLFAAHPDPRWVARPGESLHRLGTELDLGPSAAYAWLARHAPSFGFVARYRWEPWHWGYGRSAGTRSVGFGPGDGRAALPSFVPARWAPALSRAAQRWNVGAALLAAQLMAESRFNPFARSGAGALGIAQFMPGTARAYGLSDPFDGAASIDAQAHLMHDLLRRFGSVPLALAAYNAGPQPVAACGCVPPIAETTAYVTAILGLLGGAGDDAAAGSGLRVRLVD